MNNNQERQDGMRPDGSAIGDAVVEIRRAIALNEARENATADATVRAFAGRGARSLAVFRFDAPLDGTVRNLVCGQAVEHYAAISVVRRVQTRRRAGGRDRPAARGNRV